MYLRPEGPTPYQQGVWGLVQWPQFLSLWKQENQSKGRGLILLRPKKIKYFQIQSPSDPFQEVLGVRYCLLTKIRGTNSPYASPRNNSNGAPMQLTAVECGGGGGDGDSENHPFFSSFFFLLVFFSNSFFLSFQRAPLDRGVGVWAQATNVHLQI